jgi:peptidoglycan DL-endopeptidase CwlO
VTVVTVLVVGTGPVLAAHVWADTPPLPSAGEVASARQQATTTAAQVAELSAQQQAAQAELAALQLRVAEATAADQRAQEELALARAVAAKAARALEAATADREQARSALKGEAALIWTHGGTLENLDLMLSASPESVSDLQVVLDGNSRRASVALDTAASAASSATARKEFLEAA